MRKGKGSLIQFSDDFETVSSIADYHRPDILHFCEALHGFASAGAGAAFAFTAKNQGEISIFIHHALNSNCSKRQRGTCRYLRYAQIFAPAATIF